MDSLKCFLLALIIFQSHTVSAALLGTADVSAAGGGTGDSTALNMTIGMRIGDLSSPGFLLFNAALGPSSSGSIFTLDSGSSFNQAAVLLTNGLNDKVTKTIRLGGNLASGGTIQSESAVFFGTSNSNTNPPFDFHGATITSLELVIDSILINNSPTFTNWDVDARFNIYGTAVPIPPSLLLFVSGLLGLFASACRKASVTADNGDSFI